MSNQVICECGHTKAEHAKWGPGKCLAYHYDFRDTHCTCEGFRPFTTIPRN